MVVVVVIMTTNRCQVHIANRTVPRRIVLFAALTFHWALVCCRFFRTGTVIMTMSASRTARGERLGNSGSFVCLPKSREYFF